MLAFVARAAIIAKRVRIKWLALVVTQQALSLFCKAANVWASAHLFSIRIRITNAFLVKSRVWTVLDLKMVAAKAAVRKIKLFFWAVLPACKAVLRDKSEFKKHARAVRLRAWHVKWLHKHAHLVQDSNSCSAVNALKHARNLTFQTTWQCNVKDVIQNAAYVVVHKHLTKSA